MTLDPRRTPNPRKAHNRRKSPPHGTLHPQKALDPRKSPPRNALNPKSTLTNPTAPPSHANTQGPKALYHVSMPELSPHPPHEKVLKQRRAPNMRKTPSMQQAPDPQNALPLLPQGSPAALVQLLTEKIVKLIQTSDLPNASFPPTKRAPRNCKISGGNGGNSLPEYCHEHAHLHRNGYLGTRKKGLSVSDLHYRKSHILLSSLLQFKSIPNSSKPLSISFFFLFLLTLGSSGTTTCRSELSSRFQLR